MFVILEMCEQNWDLSSKILSKIGQKTRIAGRKNRWGKKQNRLIPKYWLGIAKPKNIFRLALNPSNRLL